RAVLHPFGDGLDAQGVADLVDRLDHGSLDPVVQHVLYELAVDLQVVDLQVPEVGEGGQAAAEVVEDETAAFGLQAGDEAQGAVELADRRGLGDLEAD